MPEVEAFGHYSGAYDGRFMVNDGTYASELRVIESLLPEYGPRLEIEAGTGR